MRIRIRAVGLEIDRETRSDVEDRFHVGLARLSHRIERVESQLLDQNGPRGGNDIVCRVEVHLRPAGELFIQARDASLAGAVNRALGKAVGAVKRRLGQEREMLRAPPWTKDFGAVGSIQLADSHLD